MGERLQLSEVPKESACVGMLLTLFQLVLMATNILITCEYATGYSNGNWDDRMHILINISSCGTLVGQAFSKTALGITLLRISNRKQAAILWFCIITMNVYMILKVFFTWAKYCGKSDYQNWYRFQGPCINYTFEDRFKVGGQSKRKIFQICSGNTDC